MVDLHTHTTFSDGSYTPSELIEYARQKKIRAIAVTDHDTSDGFKSIDKNQFNDIDIISGIEISADYSNTEFHIVGLFTDPDNKQLCEKMSELREKRSLRNDAVLKKLNENGIDITMEDVKRESGKKIITRAHFARAMIKKGYAKDNAQCFDEYLSEGARAYIKREVPDASEAIELIHAAGGLAVLAHPFSYKLTADRINEVIREMKKMGIDAMECYYSTHSSEQTSYLVSLCEKYGILPSGGSDFHGKNKPGLDLGVGYGKLEVKDEVYENLKDLYMNKRNPHHFKF